MTKISYKLRKFKKEDTQSLVKYANNPKIAKFLTHEFPNPYTKKDAEDFLNIVSKESPTNTFAIEINGEAAGAIAITPQNWVLLRENVKIEIGCHDPAEVGYWLAEEYWNNGIMTSVIKDILKYGFETFDIDCIYATPFIPNKASQRILTKAGFTSDLKKRKIMKFIEEYEVFLFQFQKNKLNKINKKIL